MQSMRVGGGTCAYVPLVFQSPLRTVLPLLSVSCGDSQIYWRGTRKLKRRDSRERGSKAIYMYCSLDRFCDSLSKCHFWFASDAGTVVLCTHSLDVCVCGGKVCGGRCVWDEGEGGVYAWGKEQSWAGRGPVNKRTSCWTY